ncbi:dipeptide/oligopeptide/nickel ABC transporter permease/ATP-binding protein [Streptomyces sp. NL15-2K]|uniref:dipeptide/oligopeptide/nickel ABC transporter permease/ATP-binding protein n=1 Tax=Streptomyces sp. NL15-2K TaxID=376149 RepID=UPI000F56BA31|nr:MULTISPECIES: dipeptide/oligopeptide/nickel ABC transporter permease/ATP-binding protein [Actinomycetes]WKX06349.1 dipeptide/oligopeptide/nickel ABC transporter permease/ATP-binding protein [Kutzneria buriramensis]GCB43343.1 oligopeptide transport system permease protein oppB [Streptomyces sp. NL15-2K]
MTTTPTLEPSGPVEPATKGRSLLRRLLTDPQAALCIAFLLFVVFLGLSSSWLAPHGQNVTDLSAVNASPFSPGHLLGADSTGRDILSRLMYGTRQTMIACLVVLVVSLVIGVTSGLAAGFYRGKTDAVSSWFSDVVMSMPGIVLLIALYARTGSNIVAAMAAYGLIVAPTYFRLVRSVVLEVRSELYVDAAKVVGLSDLRIVGRHVLWAVRAPIIVQSSFVLASAISIEAGMGFIGLSDPDKASWGGVLQEAFGNIYNNRPGVLWPALLITLTVLALVLLGNALRDILQSSAHSRTLSPRRRRELVQRAREERGQAAVAGTAAPTEAVLSVRGLRIGYPDGEDGVREVVHGIDLDVRRGEIHGLVGESGSGKSQIAFTTLGILPCEAVVLGGSVLLDGQDLLADEQRLREARGRRIAYIPQEPMSNLDPCFTVGAQLTHGLRAVKNISKQEAERELLKLLARVGIKNPERVFRQYPHEISGGMAQRVLICGAVASGPDVIVADEPTTALDVTVQAEVLELLRELRDERGLAVVLVTHNLGVVADICDTVSVMQDGHIVERRDVDGLFEAPAEAYTRELLSSARRVEIAEV